MTDRPYLAAYRALGELTEMPSPVLRLMAADILRIVNPTDQGVTFAADQLKLRMLLAEALRSIADSNDQIEKWHNEQQEISARNGGT